MTKNKTRSNRGKPTEKKIEESYNQSVWIPKDYWLRGNICGNHPEILKWRKK